MTRHEFLSIEASSKKAVLIGEDTLHYEMSVSNSNIRFLSEVFISNYVGIVFFMYPFLISPFNNFTDKLREGGFISYYEDKSASWKNQYKLNNEDTKVVALTIEKLSAGFQAFLAMLALAVVVFIFEVVIANVRRNVAKMKAPRERTKKNNRRKLKKPTQFKIDFIQ